ncbi:MAG TPA: hypothetical protein VMV12_06775 [Candidatus Micrarchaeaceae archaeon]|nr:hypothetical protein [Candidatus Micrarchaeaceae archaeon]
MNQDYRITAQVQPANGWVNPRAAQLTEGIVLDWVQSQIGLPPGVKLTVEAATDLGPGVYRIAHNYRAEVEGEHVTKAEALDAAVRQIGLLGVDFLVDHVIDYTLQYALAGGGSGLAAGSKTENLAPILAIGGMVIGGLVGYATRRVEPAYRLQRDRWGQWQIWGLGDASGSPELS